MDNRITLNFRTPERSDAPAGFYLTDPKEVAAWLDNLPLANPDEASRQLFKAIVEFNRLEMPNQNRIKIAEQFFNPVEQISRTLLKSYYDAPFPLNARQVKNTVLNREFYSELAIAYKLIIESLVRRNSGLMRQKVVAVSIHRALKALMMVFYHTALSYSPYPNGVWKDVHRLYAYAEQEGLHEMMIKELESRPASSTICELYKGILLFAIGSTYRLRHGEIDTLFGKLLEWSRSTKISADTTISEKGAYFVIHLNSDSPPVHHRFTKESTKAFDWLFDAGNINQALREEFDQIDSDSHTSLMRQSRGVLSRNLIRMLAQSFLSHPKRGFVRTSLTFELSTAVGLSTIHTLLSGGKEVLHTLHNPDKREKLPDKSSSYANPVRSTSDMTRQEIILHASQYRGGGNARAESTRISISEQPPNWLANQAEQEPDTFTVNTINESAGGYCIKWHGAGAPKVKVGELIGIQSASQKSQFSIGVIRWLRNTGEANFMVGLEMIAPSAEAISIEHRGRDTDEDILYDGLLLPELKAIDQPASILVSAHQFTIGDKLRLIGHQGETDIRLVKRLGSSAAFTQYQYQREIQQ